MGPLYAFRTIRDRTAVKPEGSAFAVSNDLDRRIYGGALTLEFDAPAGVSVLSNGKLLAEQGPEMTDRRGSQYVRRHAPSSTPPYSPTLGSSFWRRPLRAISAAPGR